MSEIRAAGEFSATSSEPVQPELVETRIGDAVVYVRISGPTLGVANEGEVRAVGAFDENPFDAAAKVIREGVKVIGNSIHGISEVLQPSELRVEFGFTFEAKGRASIVPVFLTGESSGGVTLKVLALWRKDQPRSA
jgi:hypothetical protein